MLVNFEKVDKNYSPRSYEASEKFIHITLQNLNMSLKYDTC